MTGDPHDDVDPDEATRISRRERAGSGESAEDVTARSRRRDPEPPTQLARRRIDDAPTAPAAERRRRPDATTVRVRGSRAADPAITAERPLVRTAAVPDGAFDPVAPRTAEPFVARRSPASARRPQGPAPDRAARSRERRRGRRRAFLLLAGIGVGVVLAAGALVLLLLL